MEAIQQLLQSEQPVKWLFYGDSITHGALHTFGHRDYTELFTERLRFELGRPMDVVIKTAISGHTTRELLGSFDWRVAQFTPHVVFIMVGMNDCSSNKNLSLAEFESNLNQLGDKIEALGGQVIMQTTCPILPGTALDREPNFPSYMETIRRVAARRGLLLIDHTKFWQEHQDKHFYWMSDAFHPNELGHMAFAHLLYQVLDIYDPGSHSCRFYFP